MKGPTNTKQLVVILLIGFLILITIINNPLSYLFEKGISVVGGQNINIKIDVPLHTQLDPRWSHQILGASGETIAESGCTLCAVAMALDSKSIQLSPSELNRKLISEDGFTPGGLIIWNAVSDILNQRWQIAIVNHPTHNLIDKELLDGNPVIAKVLWESRFVHWVLISGKEGTSYLIHDPLQPGKPHASMDAYPTGILAIRYLTNQSPSKTP